MNREVCTVAVDVGNSVVKLATQRQGSVIDHAIGIESTRWQHAAIGWVQEQVECRDADWRIASVHHAAASRLSDALAQRESDTRIRFVSHRDVPMTLDIEHPDRLGIDRLLGAFAARNRLRLPAVVIDAGSAVTIDWINAEGHFCGGAILPGLGLQSRALAQGTEALPEIQWDAECPIRLPGRNTSDAIRSGILAGLAATIDALIERYGRVEGGRSGRVEAVLTGGDGPAISPHLGHPHQRIPNLVCLGLLDLPISREGQTRGTRETRSR